MADTPLWIDLAGIGIGLAGGTTGIIALFKTGKTNNIAEDANRIAGESKDEAATANTHSVEANRIADEALRSARDSATSARESAEAAEATARIDRASRHDDRRPPHPGKIEGFHKSTTTPGSSVFGTVTFMLDYRVVAVGLYKTGGSTDLFGPELIQAGMPKEFHIQTLPGAGDPMSIQTVLFRFWPPTGMPDADEWACACGVDEEASNGHWHFRVPVEPPSNPTALVM